MRKKGLSYYKDENEYECKCIIKDFESVSKVVNEKRNFVFGIVTESRILYLECENSLDMEEWISQCKNLLKTNATQCSINSFGSSNSIISPNLSGSGSFIECLFQNYMQVKLNSLPE